jgi:hypothetical protein
MTKKIVKVTKMWIGTYEVESAEPNLEDGAAMNVIKLRMRTGMPLGLAQEKEEITAFEIEGRVYDGEGKAIAGPAAQSTKAATVKVT